MLSSDIPKISYDLLRKGAVIPALPLALNSKRMLDERRQRAIIRYYLDAGAGGIAVGVHTTQFAIHRPEIGLYKPVLQIANEEFNNFALRTGNPSIHIAGVIGETKQALAEAQLAKDNGYHAILLGLAALSGESNTTTIQHCKTIAEVMPVIGFYLQPAVGGRRLDFDFWRNFALIKNVIAIKIAPFNRYQTIDVIRAVIESGRYEEISLYTGNDDNIVADLLTEYQFHSNEKLFSKRIAGGLLGHWAVWTRKAVDLLEKIHDPEMKIHIQEYLTLGAQITDCNAAIFDAANNFSGCIAGIHEVLRRQGLLEGTWTLNKDETLSPGQKEEIDRVYKAYPGLNDDDFVSKNLDKWLS
jgi:dihydrodipicolinate synthase/N-acetylneuraminate lyase